MIHCKVFCCCRCAPTRSPIAHKRRSVRRSGHGGPRRWYAELLISPMDFKYSLQVLSGPSRGSHMAAHGQRLGHAMQRNEICVKVLTDLKNRGLKDVFIACVDGLKGFPEAIETAFPKTQTQLCFVHMVRNSLKFVPFKDYK